MKFAAHHNSQTFRWCLFAFSRLLGPKCICGHDPHWGSLQCFPDPLAGGEMGAHCPSVPFPRTPSPLSAFSLEFRPFGPQEFPPKDVGSVSNQNCCKGFHFTQKVEKHCSRCCCWPYIMEGTDLQSHALPFWCIFCCMLLVMIMTNYFNMLDLSIDRCHVCILHTHCHIT